MNRKIIISIALLACLTLLPVSTTADYPTGELGYSDEIAVGNEYEWTVSKLIATGDFRDYTSYVSIGDQYLNQGDTIKLVVLEDPDTAVGVWYDIYVDGVKVVDPLDFWIGYGYTYGAGMFISPVTYTNVTGTYNLYEQLFEELVLANDDYTYDYSTDYSGLTLSVAYTEIVEFSLVDDVFGVYMYEREYLSIQGGGYDMSQDFLMETEQTTNIVTGLLGKSEFRLEGETAYYSGTFHVLIDSEYAIITEETTPDDGTTIVPYVWGFSLFGLSAIATASVIVKRKRK